MRVSQEILMNGVSGSSSVNSSPITVEHLVNAAITVVTTGTLSGTLTVQASCDAGTDAAGSNVSTWANTTKTLTISNVQTSLIELVDMGYKWLRLSYAATSGTGTITATIHAKGV